VDENGLKRLFFRAHLIQCPLHNIISWFNYCPKHKPVWLKHGIAFEKDGKIRIKLESLPIPNKDGDIWLSLFEDTGRESYSRADGRNSDTSPDQVNTLSNSNDDIPF
jgi:hypothetical protein